MFTKDLRGFFRAPLLAFLAGKVLTKTHILYTLQADCIGYEKAMKSRSVFSTSGLNIHLMKEFRAMNTTYITTSSANLADERIDFLGKTYGMLALCIAAGSAGAYFSMGASFPQEHPWIMLGIMIGGIFGVQAVRHISGLNFAALLGFGAITGLAISPLVGFVAAKSEMLVAQAFLTTAASFVGLTAYVFISRKDFSFLKGFIWTGLIAMIVLGLSNYFFFESGTLQLAISGMSVLLFSAFILYDTSTILRDYPSNEYIAAALTLYLDVFLLFQNLLYLFGVLGGDD